MSKLLKPFGVVWGTSQVESNSIETSGYAFEDTCHWPRSLLTSDRTRIFRRSGSNSQAETLTRNLIRIVMRCLALLLFLVGSSSQKVPNASQIDVGCFPLKYRVVWQVNDPVIVFFSDTWWKATVSAIDVNTSDASDVSKFQVRWSSDVPSGASNETAVDMALVQKNDILDCFLLRGQCLPYTQTATGISCACGWTEEGVCSKDNVWSPDALFSLLQLACAVSYNPQQQPSWASQVASMLEQQGFTDAPFSRLSLASNCTVGAHTCCRAPRQAFAACSDSDPHSRTYIQLLSSFL